jgi:hypothetical protein
VLLAIAVLVAVAALGAGLALLVTRVLLPGDDTAAPKPTPTATGHPTPTGDAHLSASASPSPSASTSTPSGTPDAARTAAVTALLARRADAVTGHDRAGFLATVDPAQSDFYAAQQRLYDRLQDVDLASWSYQMEGSGPGLPPDRAVALPSESAILRVRLTYELAGTQTQTDREQYLTVVPAAGGGWLLAGDDDGASAGLHTERDLWDLGPVREVRGDQSVVVADPRGATRAEMRHLADEGDLAVRDVDDIWTGAWAREPVIVLPRSQADMATLIESNGDGLGQIAAVTTGAFESGVSRGDRIVINPEAWDSIGGLGRRVVLTHEMTHVATRATTVQPAPIWLSEGFADYVAYKAAPVPTSVVAEDILTQVRHGKTPKALPDDADFDAARGSISTSYEGAWLACRLIAERYGQKQLVKMYADLTDSAGPGWPAELPDELGVTQQQFVHDWRAYLRAKAAA